ncbi:UNVERIFIED_CONTAM: hypothetical protein Sangu_2508300 [Sesamum angustifolium]|uniref:Reverse transcriptase n=1 Tax=Sesamum angustifolium TaxID=2727405 RepID=A0AAW2JME5_9LAMI
MEAISCRLGVRRAAKHDKYLGLPSVVGRSKREVFDSIREKVWKWICSWDEKQLSQAGKEVIIKAIMQAIPTYAMGVFRFPETLIHELQSMIADFWWNNKENRKIHWLSWEKLSTSKLHGELGLHDLRAFNSAMLARQFWWLIVKPNSLVGKILRARNFSGSSILQAKLGSRPSFTWRSILSTKELVKGGLH